MERDLAANAAIVSIQLLLEERTAPTVSVLDLGDHGKIRLVCTTPPIRLSYDLLATNWTNPGLYMIGYGKGNIILKFPPFFRLNEENQ